LATADALNIRYANVSLRRNYVFLGYLLLDKQKKVTALPGHDWHQK